jgi:16S rRNA processing protein RimM
VPDSRIQLGVIGRPHGVRGLVKVTSHTANPADLTAYGPLSDAQGRLFSLRWKAEGVAEVSLIVGGAVVKVADRTTAEKLTNTKLFIDRSALPATDEEEFYLSDLVGLSAIAPDGGVIGSVAMVHDYGAGASLEIARDDAASVIVPFTRTCVPDIDPSSGRLVVILPDDVVVSATAHDVSAEAAA